MVAPRNYTRAWAVSDLPGLECFRADQITHHFDRHSHAGYVIGVSETGVSGTYYQHATHHIPPGEIIVMNPGEVHTGFSLDDPISYRLFYVDPALVQDVIPARAALPLFPALHFRDPVWHRQLRALHRLVEIPGDPLERQESVIEGLLHFLLANAFAGLELAPQREHDAVRQVKEYLHAHFTEKITLNDLAHLTQFNRAYLIRVFRQATGLPPYKYVLQLRVERAKQLLAGGMAAGDVAPEVGFADQSHLTRLFKRFVGTTPRQYADGHRH